MRPDLDGVLGHADVGGLVLAAAATATAVVVVAAAAGGQRQETTAAAATTDTRLGRIWTSSQFSSWCGPGVGARESGPVRLAQWPCRLASVSIGSSSPRCAQRQRAAAIARLARLVSQRRRIGPTKPAGAKHHHHDQDDAVDERRELAASASSQPEVRAEVGDERRQEHQQRRAEQRAEQAAEPADDDRGQQAERQHTVKPLGAASRTTMASTAAGQRRRRRR